jgi:hypothetical protein
VDGAMSTVYEGEDDSPTRRRWGSP